MFTRKQTKPIQIGHLTMGNGNPIIIQSMTNTVTKDVEKTTQQIIELEKYGCQLIRVAVLDEEDAKAISKIKSQIHIPLVADIHFNYQLALLAMDYGADKIRINPGNIGSLDNIKKVVHACQAKKIPIRIGVNSGSLEKDLAASSLSLADKMIESLDRNIKILEDLNFYDICISLKSSDIDTCLETYKKAATRYPYPIHLGMTEAGPLIEGTVQSCYVLNQLLALGIGDTLRVSLSDNPVNEIKVAKQILMANHLITMPKLISCPTCGRTQINLLKYVPIIEDYLYQINKPIKVALMGCVVNGPGEAKEADIGIAGGKGMAVLFQHGQIIKQIHEEEIIQELMQAIDAYSF